ncbi:hypothetical protein [Nocardioides sp. AE5]|uniref:hypothetical protein n=1 Tax=Nocardioides sp. AE5 TaxID=2962573 RepID=UPI0028823B99|nr:hypothetical protein [Nocardioides sp. AE5]MDT0202749.1 hypothetical protein [Nocardioides sp. AE5]
MTPCTRRLVLVAAAFVLTGTTACSGDDVTAAAVPEGPTGVTVPAAPGSTSEALDESGSEPSAPILSVSTEPPGATVPSSPAPTPAGERALDVCAAISALAAHTWILDEGMLRDATETANGSSTAILLLEGAEFPTSLTLARQDAIAFFVAVSAALAAVEIRPDQTTMEALEFSDRGDIVDALGPAKDAVATLDRHHHDVCDGATP